MPGSDGCPNCVRVPEMTRISDVSRILRVVKRAVGEAAITAIHIEFRSQRKKVEAGEHLRREGYRSEMGRPRRTTSVRRNR